eukprot:gene7228-9859_t
MHMFAVSFVWFACLFKFSAGFKPQANKVFKFQLLGAPNYKELLEQARRKKLSNVGATVEPTQLQPTQHNEPQSEPPSPPQAYKTKNDRIITSDEEDNNLPFTDEMYDHLKYVIGKLTSKMRSDISLTPSELERFRLSMEHIIADANGFTYHDHAMVDRDNTPQPVQNTINYDNRGTDGGSLSRVAVLANEINQQKQIESQTKINKNDNDDFPEEFEAFKGMKSTWVVPNQENMTTEEYYKAVNARIAEVKQKRRAEGYGAPGDADNYLKSLSKRK